MAVAEAAAAALIQSLAWEQRIPYKINPRRNIARKIVIKLKKKYKDIKIHKGKAINNIHGNPIRITDNFSVETWQARGVKIYLR